MLKKITPAEIALDLADDIEAGRLEQFDMALIHCCGSPCCIAGHVVARHGNFQGALENMNHDKLGFFTQARNILGLKPEDGSEMFAPEGYYNEENAHNTRAPSMLRHFAATGEVNWNVGEG